MLSEEAKKRRLAYSRLWRARNRDKVSEYNKNYYPSWRKNNREKLKEYHKEWSAKNPSSKGKWARENREKRNAYIRQWARINKDKIKAHTAAMRAKRRSAPGKFTVSDIRVLFERQNGLCTICKCDISSGYHVDHVVALSRGGTNWPENIQLLCAPCNLKKGAR